MAFEKLKETLERNGFQVSVFATGEEEIGRAHV